MHEPFEIVISLGKRKSTDASAIYIKLYFSNMFPLAATHIDLHKPMTKD